MRGGGEPIRVRVVGSGSPFDRRFEEPGECVEQVDGEGGKPKLLLAAVGVAIVGEFGGEVPIGATVRCGEGDGGRRGEARAERRDGRRRRRGDAGGVKRGG